METQDNSRLFSTLKMYRLLTALQRRPVSHFICFIVHCCYRLLTFLAFIFVPKAPHSHAAWMGASGVCGCLWDPPHMRSECKAGTVSDNAEPTLLQPNCHCCLPPLLHVLPVQVGLRQAENIHQYILYHYMERRVGFFFFSK